MKEETSKILEDCSKIMTNVTGIDIPKEIWRKSRDIVREKYKSIKDIDPVVYDRLKADFEKIPE
tara:strand:+ start:613 stop:804 length:192 start_codon:yes stop_codon:yes gene_type:complete